MALVQYYCRILVADSTMISKYAAISIMLIYTFYYDNPFCNFFRIIFIKLQDSNITNESTSSASSSNMIAEENTSIVTTPAKTTVVVEQQEDDSTVEFIIVEHRVLRSTGGMANMIERRTIDKKIRRPDNLKLELHFAVINNDIDKITELLIEHAKKNADAMSVGIEVVNPLHKKDQNGFTPLHWASLFGYKDVVQYLLRNGASAFVLDDFK